MENKAGRKAIDGTVGALKFTLTVDENMAEEIDKYRGGESHAIGVRRMLAAFIKIRDTPPSRSAPGATASTAPTRAATAGSGAPAVVPQPPQYKEPATYGPEGIRRSPATMVRLRAAAELEHRRAMDAYLIEHPMS